MSNVAARKRRVVKTRARIRRLGAVRLSVHRTPRHIYAQIITPEDGKVLAQASSLEKDFSGQGGNIDGAKEIGKRIAERALAAGIKQVAFDRSGFQYHGRVKALADAARTGGMEF